MEIFLWSDCLNTDWNTSAASKEWLHWLQILENFFAIFPQDCLDKLSIFTHVQGMKRLAIDYSQTIIRFTLLDAYHYHKLMKMWSRFLNFVSKVLLISEVPIIKFQLNQKTEDKPYTTFEVAGGLYQFGRVPFGVTNGVACFQRRWMSIFLRRSWKVFLPTWIMSQYLQNGAILHIALKM